MASTINKRIQKIEDRFKQRTEIPVLIVEGDEGLDNFVSGKLPFGVTDRTVVIIDDIGAEE